MYKLYDYYRSTASFRVRIALHYKAIPFEIEPIHLVKSGGEQHSWQYKKINPQQLIPALDVGGVVINQSVSILEYLEEAHPAYSILPMQPLERAYVRAIVQMISADIHPLNNLRVLNYLKLNFDMDDNNKLEWYHHWLKLGFDAVENKLNSAGLTGKYCFKDQLTMADICLVSQVYNADRFQFSLQKYPLISGIKSYLMSMKCVKKASPDSYAHYYAS